MCEGHGKEGKEFALLVEEGGKGVILQEIKTVSWTYCSKFNGASNWNKEFWMTVWPFQKMKAYVSSLNI